MTTHNTAARATAIALGAALTAGGTSLLFGDVIFGAVEFTQKHFQTITIVLGTLLAAHVAKEAWISRHWAAVLGFTAIAAAGTGLICYNSLGRQAEGVMVAAADHDKTVNERAELQRNRDADAKTAAEKRVAADAECADGEGRKCRAAQTIRDFYETNVKGYEARLALLAPPKVVDPSAERFGDYAKALGYDKEKAKTLAMLIVPYFVTLLFEFGTVISFGYGFAPKRLPKPVTASGKSKGSEQTDFPELSDAELIELRAGFATELPEPKGPNGGASVTVLPKRPKAPNEPKGSNRRLTRDEVLTDLMVRSATGRGFDSQEEAAKHYGVSPSRYSEWLRDWEAEGKIPNRRMVGRCKMIEA
jgi:hypothetical protein